MLSPNKSIKIQFVSIFMLLSIFSSYAQQKDQYQQNNKGKFYAYWGWNR
jgi:hypothetical protein